MKKVLVLLFIFIGIFFPIAANGVTLTGGVSATDNVPVGFFGTWKVMAVRSETTNFDMFVPYSVEVWNFTKNGDVITLTNPVSGAEASITVKESVSNTFVFQRVTKDKEETVTETAKLTLNGDNFYGLDTMSVKTYKNGTLIKHEKCTYTLKATKVSGSNIGQIFGLK